MLTEENIKQLIAQGENIALEFKRADINADSLAKEIVAFANSSGGSILIGVEDDGAASGIESSKINEEWASNIARNNCIPAVDVEAAEVDLEGKKILYIKVPKGKDKPYQTNRFQYLIRVGSTNRVATQGELMRLFQQGGVFHYDSLAVDRTDERVLNYTKVDNYFNLFGIRFDAEPPDKKTKLLQNADIMAESGELTVAGTLCFALNPGRYLPQTGVMFGHFQGKRITDELIDRQMVLGTIDYVIDTTMAVIKNNLKTPSTIVGAKREEKPQPFSDKVIRELITNACAHRDYSIVGSQIRVLLYEDRLEIHSPGRLPNAVSIDKIKVGASYSRNPIISTFLIHLRYYDRFGRGIPMILQEASENNKQINLEEFGEEFIVTLYF